MVGSHTGQKLYQIVASALSKAIAGGQYKFGERLPSERHLAEQFGVSRPAVREAIVALGVQGLVDARHGSGVYVTGLPSTVDIGQLDTGAFDLTEARRVIEGEVAALAAICVEDSDIEELEKLLREMRAE